MVSLFSLFSAAPSGVERCDECRKPMGLDAPRPIPLCGNCFHVALHAHGTEFNMRLGEVYRSAFKAYVKLQQQRPTMVDATDAMTTGLQDMTALRTAADKARRAGDTKKEAELLEQIAHLHKAASTLRTQTLGVFSQLDRGDE